MATPTAKRGNYKKYLIDSKSPIPITTKWRLENNNQSKKLDFKHEQNN